MSQDLESAKNEYLKIQAEIKNLKVKIITKNQKKELDLMTYLSIITQRPNISKAQHFTERLKSLKSKDLTNIKEEILRHIEYVQKVKTNLKEYLHKKSDFREAMKLALKKIKNFSLYQNLKNDWKLIRKFLNDVNLHDEELVKYFVILESLFRILKYYHEKRDIDTYESTREVVKQLGEEWDFDEMVLSDRLVKHIFQKFYTITDNEAKEIMLGKRSLDKPQALDTGVVKKLKIGSENGKEVEVKEEERQKEIIIKDEGDVDSNDNSKKSSKEKEHPVALHFSRMIKQKTEEVDGADMAKDPQNSQKKILDLKKSSLIGLRGSSKIEEERFKLEEDADASTFERIFSSIASNKKKTKKPKVKKSNDLDSISKITRQNSVNFLFESLSITYPKNKALTLAKNLENQIYADHSLNTISYENEIRRCGNTLEQLSSNRGLIDKIMMKFIDLEILRKLTLKPIHKVDLGRKDFSTQVEVKDFLALGQNFGKAEKEFNDEKPDFGREEPLKNIKEDETKMLRKLVFQLKKENSGLKATLTDIRSGLLAYSSPVKTVDSRGSEAR